MAEKATTIVRVASFSNRTPKGRASATGARRLAQYFAYGRGTRAQQLAREQRGQWYSEQGKRLRHEDVMEWVNREGKAHRYTHQFILSTRYARLLPEEYGRALRAGGDLFPEWRLIAHHDSNYSHAHVLAFGNEELIVKDREFQEWCLAVRQELDRSQEQHMSQYEQEQQQHEQQRLELQEMANRLERSVSLGQGKGLEL